MIYFIDDFLPSYILDETIKDLSAQEYQELKAGNESFHYLMAKPNFIKYTIDSLEKLEGNKITSILNWFRLSNDKIQDNWKIHSDGIIQGQKPDRALVLYISPKKKKDLHGTAFWKHKKHGKSLPYDTTDKEFDRMILKDSEDLSVWTLNTVIGYEQNRAVSYPANYFHSKYPNKSWKEGREVFVMFYKTEINK